MQDDGEVAILDMSLPSDKSISLEMQELKNLKLTEMDSYVFTSYSSYLPAAVDDLLGFVYVKNLYLPLPENEDELTLAEKILTENIGSKATFHFYQTDEFVICGKFNVFTAYRSADKSKLALTILYRDSFYTYLSSGMLENDTKNVALPLIDGCDTLILGRHGNSYSNYRFIYQVEGLKRLIVSGKDLTLPAETVRFYDAQNTDLCYSPKQIELYVE